MVSLLASTIGSTTKTSVTCCDANTTSATIASRTDFTRDIARVDHRSDGIGHAEVLRLDGAPVFVSACAEGGSRDGREQRERELSCNNHVRSECCCGS